MARLINHLLCASQGWGFAGEMSEHPFSSTHCVLVIEGAGGKSVKTCSKEAMISKNENPFETIIFLIYIKQVI